jgi:hypothetical protein
MLRCFGLGLMVLAFGLTPVAAQTDSVLYLMGRVVMEDDTAPPSNLRVELYCGGRVVRQSFPNEKGLFSFDLGSRKQTQTVTDASATPTTGGLEESFARDAWSQDGFQVQRGKIYLDDCVVRLGASPEYRAAEITLGIRNVLEKPDIGELLVSRISGRSGLIDASVPPQARKEFESAVGALTKEKPDRKKARGHLEKATRVHPEYGQAWALYGALLLEDGDSKGAREALGRATEISPTMVEPWVELAQIAIESSDWATARQMASKALELDPDAPRGLLYMGLAQYYRQRSPHSHWLLGRLEELGLLEQYPIAVLHLGMLYARMGDIPAAGERLRKYLAIEDPSSLSAERRQSIERQLAQWEASGALP